MLERMGCYYGEGGGRRRSVRKYLYIFEEETICTTLIVYCPWKIVRYIFKNLGPEHLLPPNEH